MRKFFIRRVLVEDRCINGSQVYRSTLSAIVATVLALGAVVSPSAEAAEDQFGPICLRYYTPTQFTIPVGGEVAFPISNSISNTRLDVETWEMNWGDVAIDVATGYRELAFGQTFYITHRYVAAGTYIAQFEW
jgi:hypothetical protein